MSFGSGGGFSGFGQQNQQQQSTFGSGGFGSTTGASTGKLDPPASLSGLPSRSHTIRRSFASRSGHLLAPD